MPAPQESQDSPLSLPSFKHFVVSRFGASFAFQMISVAVGWQIYALTHSAFYLGLIGLAQFVPMVCLTLLVGHVADKYDRRRIVSICMGIEACMALLLAVTSLLGMANLAFIFTAIVVISSARTFESPTIVTLIPALVSRAQIPRATAYAVSTNQVAQIVGPALGGVGYALGAGWVYAASATLYIIGCTLMFLMKLERSPPRKEPTSWKSLFAGIHFILNRRILFGTLSLDLFAVLLGATTALLPMFAKDILQAGPWALGFLRSAPACGGVLMSIFISRRGLGTNIGTTLFSALVLFGLATVMFGLSRSIPMSVAALVVLGATDSISMVVRSSLVQINTPEDMLGRVSAVNQLFIGTSNQLGELKAGFTAAWLGPIPTAVLGGIGTIAVAALWMFWFPELRHLRSLEQS